MDVETKQEIPREKWGKIFHLTRKVKFLAKIYTYKNPRKGQSHFFPSKSNESFQN